MGLVTIDVAVSSDVVGKAEKTQAGLNPGFDI